MFGVAYGIQFYAPLGMSTEEEVGPRSLVALIKAVIMNNLRKLFAESISDSRVLRQITEETGATLGEDLFSDSLSETYEPASTYEKMMMHNARALVEGMRR